MTKEKRALYQKAYVEIYEMINFLTNEEREKIPKYFIDYICNNMDTNYTFHIDNLKGLLEQDYMIETKALIIRIYEKYFAPESETEFWNNYHRICSNMIDEEKKKKHNINDSFKNQEQIPKIENEEKSIEETMQLVPIENKESIFTKIKNWLKRSF